MPAANENGMFPVRDLNQTRLLKIISPKTRGSSLFLKLREEFKDLLDFEEYKYLPNSYICGNIYPEVGK